jgi:hypothetical protein
MQQATHTTAPQTTAEPGSPLRTADRPRVGRTDAGYEREAATVADSIASWPGAGAGADAGARAGHRSRDRGHALSRMSISRLPRQAPRARDTGEPIAPASVQEVLASPGQPLDPLARHTMQQHLDFDFGQIRVHAEPRAAASARAIGALAYTAGRHVVFGEGHYPARDGIGARLLAHELTHVVQQSSASLDTPAIVQRATALESFGRGLRDVLFFVPSLFGAELSYSDDELTEYLDGIDEKGTIDGGYYSDDKARQIVQKSRAGNAKFPLTPKQSRLLMMEMEDGIVTDGDRDGILELLQKSSEEEASLDFVFGPGGLGFHAVMSDMRKEPFHARFNAIFTPWFVKEKFSGADGPQAARILRDLLAVTEDQLDFTDLPELQSEVTKRLRTTQLMKESQNGEAFDYPENMKPGDCADFKADTRLNARVNLDARPFWTDVILDPDLIYYFKLTTLGKDHAFEALTKLFTPQGRAPADREAPDPSICKKTLIHCDYLTNVIHFRVFAESIGPAAFDEKVKSGALTMWLTYTGFPKQSEDDWRKSPLAKSLQYVRPASEEDLVIGDHVIFWNHLAYDGLNVTKHGAWRLENAVLVDQDSRDQDLFQGHGTTAKTNNQMRDELAGAYNPFAAEAMQLADAGDDAKLHEVYPNVKRKGDEWIVEDPGRDPARKGDTYKLRTVDEAFTDPEMPGLRDPHDPDKMGFVQRPVESAEGRPPKI